MRSDLCLSPVLALGCAAACATSTPTGSVPLPDLPSPTPPSLASLAPSKLHAMLAEYDQLAAGPAKDKLAAEIDAFAHQKYATVSRIYWHTDFAAARVAAHAEQKPILHLRMLGRLDEDLSCANSRLFRATLYANRDVSQFLRDNFILYWSAERPVPRVTIDYGDGRKIERTTTGNSAHYVHDETGRVIDVLPGLYAPVAFRKELTESLALAQRVRGKSEAERANLVFAYHQAQVTASTAAAQQLAGTPYLPSAGALISQERVQRELAVAQRATVSKAAIEISDLRYILAESAPEQWPEHEIGLWASAGQILYGIGDLKRADLESPTLLLVRAFDGAAVLRPARAAPGPRRPAMPPSVLDDQSRALVARLHDAVPEQLRGTTEQKDVMIRRLEQNLVADSALNELRLRPRISLEITRQAGRVDFDKLNAFVYRDVFRTPKEDAWLGLLPRTDFTGIPGDGVVLR